MSTGLKARTINLILCRKFDGWLNSIEDESLREKIKPNVIITGGCLASMLLGEPVKDYDIYFTDPDTAEAVAKYYLERFKKAAPATFTRNWRISDMSVRRDADRVRIYIKSAGVASEAEAPEYQYFEGLDPGSPETEEFVEAVTAVRDMDAPTPAAADSAVPPKAKYRPVFMSSNAVTLSDHIQLIVRFTGDPAEIHHNFDFVHCTNYWTSAKRRVTLNPSALECLLVRELRYIGSLYPLCSLIRTRKFVERGWRINAGQFLKMAMQLSELDLTDHQVLQEQLTGVDAAYFVELLSKLRDSDPEKVNSAYLVQLIDKMF